MKSKLRELLFGAVLLAVAQSMTRGQGTFQNLDFESASPGPTSPNTVGFGAAFPGWNGYVGGVQQATALYNLAALDSSAISIVDRGWSRVVPNSGGVISGNFTALLQAGTTGPVPTPADTTLSQTGLVPTTAQSLEFKAYFVGVGVFTVTLGSQQLSLTPLGSGSNYTLYGADIHAVAGQTAELDFTLLAEDPHVNNRYLFLDSIQFSSQPIPEPGVFGLCALGAVLFGWRVHRRR